MINFKVVHWTDLIELPVNGVCEPPLTLDFSDDESQNSLLIGEKINLPDFPWHSEGVERAVKLVTEASQSVYGFEARHQHILAKVLCQRFHLRAHIWNYLIPYINNYLTIICLSIFVYLLYFNSYQEKGFFQYIRILLLE